MKTTAALLSAVLLAGASPARAGDGTAPRGRGWLTGVGLGAAAVSLTGFGLGLAGLLNAGDANALLDAYVGNGRAPLTEEAVLVLNLQTRARNGQTLATAGFTLGGVGLAGAVVCLVLDGVWAGRPVDVAFAPAAGGGALVFTGRF
ncbi:MAG: hypothetical protein AB1730_27800 [Myxococcota bacterium]